MKAKYVLGLIIIFWVAAWSVTAHSKESSGLDAEPSALLERVDHLITPGDGEILPALRVDPREAYTSYRQVRDLRFTLWQPTRDATVSISRKGLRLQVKLGQ